MSDIAPRRSNRPTRRAREQRAYQLVLVGSTAAVIAVVGAVLSIVGIVGGGIPFLAAVIAVICLILFRRVAGK